MNAQDHDRLAAEYVLGLLEAGDAARTETLLARDEGFREAVEAWRRHFAALDATVHPVEVGEDLWDRIESGLDAASPRAAQVSVAPAAPLARMDVRSAFVALWRSLPFWRVAGLAGVPAALALAIGLLWSVGRSAPPVLIAVLVTDDNRPAAVLNAFADGRAELIPLGPIPVPAGRALQIWTLWDRARGPVSLGLLDRARTVRLGLHNLPPTAPNQLFEITLEPETGSPTGRPTGPILMKGLTSQAL